MDAQMIKQVVDSLQLTAENATIAVPFRHKDGDASLVIAREGWKELKTILPVPPLEFPRNITVADLGSFVSYLKDFGGPTTVCFAGEQSLVGVIDYAKDKGALERSHKVSLPAGYSPATVKPVAAVKAALGKWISQEALDELVQVAGVIIPEATTFLEAISDLEGVEVTKVQRTSSRHSIGFTGEVKGKGSVDIPRELTIRGSFMGQAVSATIPIRCSVQQNAIKFQLIDNGAIAAAETAARLAVIAQARQELGEAIPVFDGVIS